MKKLKEMKKTQVFLVFALVFILFSMVVFAQLSSINLVNPAGSEVSGTVLLNATFNSLTNIVSANFYILNLTSNSWQAICDNASITYVNPVSELTCSWDSSEFPDSSSYVFNITVSNETDNYSDANADVTIDNYNPKVAFINPNNNWYNSSFNINASIVDCISAKYRYENSTTNSLWTNLSTSGLYWSAVFNISNFSQGNYSLRINATDSAGNSNFTQTSFFGIDTTNPGSPSFSCTPSSVEAGSTVTCSCSGASDSISGLDTSYGTNGYSFTTNPSTSSEGTFYLNCTVRDLAGNSNSASDSYTVTAASDDDGDDGDDSDGGIADSGDNEEIVYDITDSQFKNGTTRLLRKDSRMKFEIENKNHYVKLSSLNYTQKKVTLIVSSIPQTAIMLENSTKKFDVTGDNNYDLQLTVIKIFTYIAKIEIIKIDEPKTNQTASTTNSTPASTSATASQDNNETVEDTKKIGIVGNAVKKVFGGKKLSTWIIFILVVIIMGMGGGGSYFYFFILKKKRYYKKGY